MMIDCTAKPFVPEGCWLEEHWGHHALEHDAVMLWQAPSQKRIPAGVEIPSWKVSLGSMFGIAKWRPSPVAKIVRGVLLDEVRQLAFENGCHVVNATALDFFLEHPECISSQWEGKATVFFGTLYRHRQADNLLAAALYQEKKGDPWKRRMLDLGAANFDIDLIYAAVYQ